MAKASYIVELLSHRERDKLLLFVNSRQDKQNECNRQMVLRAFMQWLTVSNQIKKAKQDEEHKRKVLEILRNSSRGQRSTMEKEILRRFVSNNLTCIPKSISFTEMDQLCNELDWYPLIGRSIIFLQGDFGNVYYMIASGSVGLYLEPSKDREMTIAREFGSMRGQPFFGDDEELKKLGNNILTLTAGSGFGEYAILATTNKIRSAAAVAVDPESFLLIMHADTYNNVLRQHHYRQKQLSSATALLQELPLFKAHNYSKIASIAYTMKSQSHSSATTLAKYGEVINNVMLIVSGQVKVFAPPSTQEETDRFGNNFSKIIEKRIPKLAVAMLGRGQIVGEIEVGKGSRTFLMDYETASATTEILEMPATTFKESISSVEIRQSMIYKSIEDINEEKEQRRVGRLTRAYDAVKKMMEGNSSEKKAKQELMNILPSIVDSHTSTPYTESPAISSKSRRLSAIPLAVLESTVGGESVKVTRKASFAVTNLGDLDKIYDSSPSGKIAAAQAAVLSEKNISTKSPNTPRKSSLLQSPRAKLSFGVKN